MKKQILTFLSIALSTVAFCQTNFTFTNEPTIGESRTLYLCDSNSVDFAAITGSGVTWNYGTTNTYSNETRLLSIISPSATGYAADFPGSTKVAAIQDFISTFISSDASGRVSQGYLIESVDLGVIKAKFTNDAQNLMTYPFALNGQVNDIFSGNLSFTYGSIPQNPSCSGNSATIYDGFGTLIQVNGVPVANVSRFHVTDTTEATIPIFGNVFVIRNQFEYYDLASTNKTPIFVHSHVKIESGFPDPLVELSVVLSAVTGLGTAGVSEINENLYRSFPNPASDQITFSNLPEKSTVSLVDLTGKAVKLEKSGTNTFSLINFSSGVYILKFETTDRSYTSKLIIE